MPTQITEINLRLQNFYSDTNRKDFVTSDSLSGLLLILPGYYGKIFLLLLLRTAKEKESQD